MNSPSRPVIKRCARATATLVLAGALLAVAGMPAAAGARIALRIDHARVLPTDLQPATVVVGNPSIADITVQNGALVLQGKSHGTTNIILLDQDGAELATFDVAVGDGAQDRVSVFKAGARHTYVCLETCEVELRLGDSGAHFETVSGQITAKSGVAAGARPPNGQ